MKQDYLFTQVLNTLPLKGSIMSRNPEGQKTIDGGQDVILPKWRDIENQHYTPASEATTAPLLAAVIDKNLVFIDFDVEAWFQEALDICNKHETPAYIAISDKGDGHIGYKLGDNVVRQTLTLELDEELTAGHYTKALDKLFGNGLKGKIDIQYGAKKLIYLASSGNHTKTLISAELNNIDQFTDMPREMIYYIQSLLYTYGTKTRTLVEYKSDEMGLYGDLTEAFVDGDNFDKKFFETVTPHKWRDKVKPDLHPSNLTEKPHDYLYAFATKLGSDASVNEEVFTKAINKINSLCIPSKNSMDVMAQIITPITSGSARIEDEPIWKYNENWKTATLTVTNRESKTSHGVYLDTTTQKYLWFDLTQLKHRFLTPMESTNTIKAFDSKRVTKWQEKTLALTTMLNIRKPYGLDSTNYGLMFNTYKTPKPIQVFHDPEVWDTFPEVDPEFFIYLKNILGTDLKVTYWLRWMATRLKTRNFSKVVWMLDGIGGAGKTPLGQIMANMVGALEDREILRSMSKDKTDDKYNTYLTKAWVVLIDEIGDFHEKAKKAVAGMVKDVTGSEGVAEIRGMNTDWVQRDTYVTFVLTTNTTFRLFAETNQTRLLYARTRTVMPRDWIDRGLVDKWVLREEFAFSLAAYLAQHVEILSKSEYSRVPEWVYENDRDWREYNRLQTEPELALLDIFMKQDKIALIEFLGVDDWADVPHKAAKRQIWNADINEYEKQSLIWLKTRKGVPNSIEAMVGNQLNLKLFLKLLQDNVGKELGGIKSVENQLVSQWNVEPAGFVKTVELSMPKEETDLRKELE